MTERWYYFQIARSVTNRSDVDNDSSILNRQPSLNGKESQDGRRETRSLTSRMSRRIGDMGFFTDTVDPEHQEKRREIRNLFQKAAMGVVFLMTLKHRAKKNRPVCESDHVDGLNPLVNTFLASCESISECSHP